VIEQARDQEEIREHERVGRRGTGWAGVAVGEAGATGHVHVLAGVVGVEFADPQVGHEREHVVLRRPDERRAAFQTVSTT